MVLLVWFRLVRLRCSNATWRECLIIKIINFSAYLHSGANCRILAKKFFVLINHHADEFCSWSFNFRNGSAISLRLTEKTRQRLAWPPSHVHCIAYWLHV